MQPKIKKKRVQNLRPHPRLTELVYTVTRFPSDSSATFTERRNSYIPAQCPSSLGGNTFSHRVLLCASAASPFHDEQVKLFAVFLHLKGNSLLYKFHTTALALTFGSIQSTHILLSSNISLVIYRLHVLFSG